jgi:hypothetical protein
MAGKRLADGGKDPLPSLQELSDKFETNSSGCSNDKPRLAILAREQDVRNEIHGWHKMEDWSGEGNERPMNLSE